MFDPTNDLNPKKKRAFPLASLITKEKARSLFAKLEF